MSANRYDRNVRLFEVGQRVLYSGAWGTDAPRETTITSIGEKNGQCVYGNDLGHWGYADQYAAVGSMKYAIRASRSGSSQFGAAASLCKEAGGAIMTFDTREAAEKQAQAYNARTVSMHVTYEAVPLEGSL